MSLLLTEQMILETLRPVRDPDLGRSLVEANELKKIHIQGSSLVLDIEQTTPNSQYKARIESDVRAALAPVSGLSSITINWSWNVRKAAVGKGQPDVVPSVKNVILVGSGKGGVGKSTVAVNLALSLQKAGARVGLMDADIYGPSIPLMLGVRNVKPKTSNGKDIVPVEAHGIKLISIGFFVDPEQATVWRGPMLHGAIMQFFRDVQWGELDYLVLDLPPGTGDIQLTIAQQIKVAGAVIVTTPQDLALADAIKAKAMFDKVDIPVLGIVENMSYFICPHCDGRTEIFHHGGGEAAAVRLNVPFLGAIPLELSIRQGGDTGMPVCVAFPDSAETKAFSNIASKVSAHVSQANAGSTPTSIGPTDPRPLVQIRL